MRWTWTWRKGRWPTRATSRRVREPLDSRELPTLITTLTATLAPALLFPPNGRFVPVTVTGTVQEFNFAGGRLTQLAPSQIKTPPTTNIQVVDEYRRVEPHGRIALTPRAKDYTFTFTTYLQASRV